ncbi:MAG: DUF465 domain-containing protein [Pseudomonadota bacterium]
MTDRDPPEKGPPRLTVIETIGESGRGEDALQSKTPNASLSPAAGAANDEAILIRIALLEEDHNDLSQAIEALEALPHHDRLSVARLKKKKLLIKDKIQTLKDSLTPDIIA